MRSVAISRGANLPSHSQLAVFGKAETSESGAATFGGSAICCLVLFGFCWCFVGCGDSVKMKSSPNGSSPDVSSSVPQAPSKVTQTPSAPEMSENPVPEPTVAPAEVDSEQPGSSAAGPGSGLTTEPVRPQQQLPPVEGLDDLFQGLPNEGAGETGNPATDTVAEPFGPQ